MPSRRSVAFILAAGAGAIVPGGAVAGRVPGAGYLVASALLVVPGYLWCAALRSCGLRLSNLDVALLSVGLSMVCAIGGGLLLNLIGIALTASSWSAWTLLVSTAGAGLAYLRLGSGGAGGTSTRRGDVKRSLVEIVGWTLVVVLVGAAAVNARQAAVVGRRTPTTELSIVLKHTHGRRAGDVEVRNLEAKPMRYRAVVTLSGAQISRVVRTRERSLTAQGTWRFAEPLPPLGAGDWRVVHVALFRGAGATTPYRSVHLVVVGPLT